MWATGLVEKAKQAETDASVARRVAALWRVVFPQLHFRRVHIGLGSERLSPDAAKV